MPSLMQQAGAQPQKQPKYAPLFMDSMFTGLITQRAALHDPSDVYTRRFYGGRPDALWMGKNIELTNRLTLQRRPGLSEFSTAVYPTTPTRAYSFQLANGTVQVIIDTGQHNWVASSVVANSPSTGQATLSGSFTGGGSDALVGLEVRVSGFTNAGNNGTFTILSSTTTTLVYANTNATTESATLDSIAVHTSGAVYIDNQDGTKTLLFAKDPGASQAYFVGVGGILYIGDGVDTKKYTPGNTNGVLWNWGIEAPAAQPGVVITESGAAAVSWVASTFWSTMGLIYDSTTHTIQQLNRINSNTDNSTGLASTTLGKSGAGGPTWNNTPGGTTSDNSITWTNRGPIVRWTPNTKYQNASSYDGSDPAPCIVYDPGTKFCFIQSNSNPGDRLSGPNPPQWKTGPGQHTNDGAVVWIPLGPAPGIPGQWLPSHTYPALGSVSDNDVVSSVSEPVNLTNGFPTNVPIYWQTSSGGTSASSGAPSFSSSAGQPTSDGDLTWLSLGSGDFAANTPVVQWTASGQTFSAIKDSNGNFQVCIKSGTTGSSAPSWAQTYGSTTDESQAGHGGTAIWVCVGTASHSTWVASRQWYLPAVGFAPPTQSQPFGGAAVIDSNSNVEFTVESGLGGASAPTWNTLVGGTLATGTTTDNQATWYNLKTFSANSLAWQTGYSYAYSFKARALDDFYSTPDSTGAYPVPPGLSQALPNPPTGSQTGAISTASPAYNIVGSNAGAVNTISGFGSTDPQVDTIVIWRSADGGGEDQMFELTEIPAPPPIGGVAQPWSFQDYLPDTPTSVFPGLNALLPAPIDDQNDPPPSTFLPQVYNFTRIWGSNGQTVPFSGGPDIPKGVGNPNECFNPSDELPFLAPVVRLVQTSQGIITFLTDSIEVIAGGPLTSSFFSVTVGPNIGLMSYNALDIFAGELYFFSADKQFRIMSPSLNVSNAGFSIADQFANLPSSGVSDATWNPANVYVAIHQDGIDNAVFVADGSTGWYRLNPRQVPGVQGPEPIWSPFAAITNGCTMVQSIQTQPGIKKLLVGAAANTLNSNILYRDLTVFTDNGTEYDAWFIMGSIKLADRGQLALLKFLEMDFSGTSYRPTVSYLLNEISGTFTPFVMKPVFDPPSLYGRTIVPQSYSPNRYYFSQNASLARAIHLQIKVDFGQTSNGDEIYDLTIFGRLMVEL